MSKNSRITVSQGASEKKQARRDRKRIDRLTTIARRETRASYSRNGGRF